MQGHVMETAILYKNNRKMDDVVVCNSTKLKPHKGSYKEHSSHLLIV